MRPVFQPQVAFLGELALDAVVEFLRSRGLRGEPNGGKALLNFFTPPGTHARWPFYAAKYEDLLLRLLTKPTSTYRTFLKGQRTMDKVVIES